MDKIESLRRIKKLMEGGFISKEEFGHLKSELITANKNKEEEVKTVPEKLTIVEKSDATFEKGETKKTTVPNKLSNSIIQKKSKRQTLLIIIPLLILSVGAFFLLANPFGADKKSSSLAEKSIAGEIDLVESDTPSDADIAAQQAEEEAFKKIQEYLYSLEDPMQYKLTDYNGNQYGALDEWHNFIGWSGDSTFYFVEYSCNGGCGCCGADIRSYNLVYDSIASIQPYRVNEEVPLNTWKWVDSSKYLVAAYTELESVMDQFNISADGPGTFYRAGTEAHAGNIEHVDLEQNETEFQCLFHLSDGTCAPVWSGSKETVLNNWISTEDEPFYSEVMVSYLGYFKHPTNEDQLLVCFLEGSAGGYENEIESRLKFVPFNSSKARKFNRSDCQSLGPERLDAHNTYLRANVQWDKWDTLSVENGETVLGAFEYGGGQLYYEQQLIEGDLPELFTWFGEDEDYPLPTTIYISQKSASLGYYAIIVVNGYSEHFTFLFDTHNNFAINVSRPPTGTRLISWAPRDLFALLISSYEDYVELSSYNLRKQKNVHVKIDGLLNDFETIVFDETTIHWISDNSFEVSAWVYCSDYGDAPTEHCDFYDENDWNGNRLLGRKYSFRVNCNTGDIHLLK